MIEMGGSYITKDLLEGVKFLDFRTYIRMRDEYLANAERFIAKGELRKASEMLWGAITQAVKAIAAKRDIRLETHRQLILFVRELARELKDEKLYEDFLIARQLHVNFYDEVLDPVDFEIIAKRAYTLLKRLNEVLSKIN